MKQKEFTDIEEKILDVIDYWIEKIKQGLEKIERIFFRMDEKEEEEEKEGDGTFKKVAEIAVLSSQIPPLIPEEEKNDDKIL